MYDSFVDAAVAERPHMLDCDAVVGVDDDDVDDDVGWFPWYICGEEHIQTKNTTILMIVHYYDKLD